VSYEDDKCEVKISKKCKGKEAGYLRRPQYAQQGPWLDACEPCARTPYEQPAQFQEDPAQGF
jgi:hypothetical protein